MPNSPTRRGGCHCGPRGSCRGRCAASATGGTQQSNRDDKSQRHQKTGGVVASRHEVGTPANERQCHNKRCGEEEEVADAMTMMKDNAAGVGTGAAGWEDEDDETR
jgi:hypothetical protein